MKEDEKVTKLLFRHLYSHTYMHIELHIKYNTLTLAYLFLRPLNVVVFCFCPKQIHTTIIYEIHNYNTQYKIHTQ